MRIVVVQSADPVLHISIRGALSGHELDLVGSSPGPELLTVLEEARADCLLLDLRAAEAPPLELLAAIRERRPGLKVVVLSDSDDADAVTAAFVCGADAYVLATSAPGGVGDLLRELVEARRFVSVDDDPSRFRRGAEVLAHIRPEDDPGRRDR